ncbi:hypothetical protein BCR43DRAFT_80196 [Syncephalastrum racemosum]|uniref:Integrator complex subunit 5 C-terminal domain-containing protein n=1 Tax=Syncephalastrum racemosum TaxID=13706 RepID=A0A1X2H2Z4_SYNRA|nr:hypothetical protein BCR43DRAFT_80196 [Syncephalastrum racemosum]
MNSLFELVAQSSSTPVNMLWLAYHVGDKLPDAVISRLHEYLILYLAQTGNPYMSSSSDMPMTPYQTELATLCSIFVFLLPRHKDRLNSSINKLLQEYQQIISPPVEATYAQRFLLGYIMTLPQLAPELMNSCWRDTFLWMLDHDMFGAIFLFETRTETSMIRNNEGEEVTVTKVFPLWLKNVAFNQNGIILKHAFDVAVVLDTMAHDARLDLKQSLQPGNNGLLEGLQPLLENRDLAFASIDMIKWILSILGSSTAPYDAEDLRIPKFLLQLFIFRHDQAVAADIFVSLISRLSIPKTYYQKQAETNAQDVILNLLEAAETKWPGVLSSVLVATFHKTIAAHVVSNSEDTVELENVLFNLSMLFEDVDNMPQKKTAHAFKEYMVLHWRQVLMLFVSHPSMESRLLGYRLLRHSHFWEFSVGYVEGFTPDIMAKQLAAAWFRHMKNRYLLLEGALQDVVADELSSFISHCCQNVELAQAILSEILDGVLAGALETFPTADLSSFEREKIPLIDKVRHEVHGSAPNVLETLTQAPSSARPPFYFITSSCLENDMETKDKIYMDNIRRTSDLFQTFRDLPRSIPEGALSVCKHVMEHWARRWKNERVPLESYDKVLPKNIPCERDVAIGNDFKDHPGVFPIFERCAVIGEWPISDITRSLLVYFIAFWHIPKITQAPSALTFATQVEQTARMLMLLQTNLPAEWQNIYQLLPFMSPLDIAAILYEVVWPYVRWSEAHANSTIPGIRSAIIPGEKELKELEDLKDRGSKKLREICKVRSGVFRTAVAWAEAFNGVQQAMNLN